MVDKDQFTPTLAFDLQKKRTFRMPAQMMVTVKNQSCKEVSEAWSRLPMGRAAFGTSGQAGLSTGWIKTKNDWQVRVSPALTSCETEQHPRARPDLRLLNWSGDLTRCYQQRFPPSFKSFDPQILPPPKVQRQKGTVHRPLEMTPI